MNYYEESLKDLKKNKGRLNITSNVKITDKEILSVAYTPGVARPCEKIKEDSKYLYDYTIKSKTVGVITDGSAVLGLGNIGAEASLPVMEGKCALFAEFAGLNAIPIAVKTQDVEEFIQTVKMIEPIFGGINLEDISAPRCFEIEDRLKKELSIPVFHDDQHGTAVVVTAGLINALKIVKKQPEDLKIVISGAGAAGTAITKMLLKLGVKNIILTNSKGIINKQSFREVNYAVLELLSITNKEKISGGLEDAIKNADVFIGVSAPNILTEQMVQTMNDDPIVFAMSNPEPEIDVELAKSCGVRILATGRSDHPNQINNVLAFPGIFKGALMSNKKQITEEMKMAAALTLSSLVKDGELSENKIIPLPFDEGIADSIAESIMKIKN